VATVRERKLIADAMVILLWLKETITSENDEVRYEYLIVGLATKEICHGHRREASHNNASWYDKRERGRRT
jgi:hypothetical protein